MWFCKKNIFLACSETLSAGFRPHLIRSN